MLEIDARMAQHSTKSGLAGTCSLQNFAPMVSTKPFQQMSFEAHLPAGEQESCCRIPALG